MKRRRLLEIMAVTIPAAVGAEEAKSQVKIVSKQELSGPFAGMEETTVEVTYPPGASSTAHRHGGMVFGYVLEGEYRFAINDEPARVLRVGETFYEPFGSKHSTSANASTTKTARILAVMIGEKGKPLTTPA